MPPNSEKAHYVIKKIKRIQGGGHHGGAWKIAYADFVTAMMAFFLLMWLLSSTTSDTKKGIAEYFDPQARVKGATFGPDRLSGDSINISERKKLDRPTSTSNSVYPIETGNQEKTKLNQPKTQHKSQTPGKKSKSLTQSKYKKFKDELDKAISTNPELKPFMKNLLIDENSEGLRIQILDRDEQGMFPLGSPVPYQHTRELLAQIANMLADTTNLITIYGHTDAANFDLNAAYTNWELSADRANVARKIIVDFGVDSNRIYAVTAKEATDLLVKENPDASENRRITIVLLNDKESEEIIKDSQGKLESKENKEGSK